MANYNLLEHAGIYSVTYSGTGNISFTGTELSYLYDGDTSISGIDVSVSDVLFLETDFSYRVKTDSIRLYISSATASGTVVNNIGIEYKTTSTGIYTPLDVSIGPGYYYADNLPIFFAPSAVRISISSTECTIYEIILYNDDEIVDFGTDGTLEDSVLLEIYNEDNDPIAIPIYNDGEAGADPISAYVCIDYTQNNESFEIAAKREGPYYDINDGILLSSSNKLHKNYWEKGYFFNTHVVDDNIEAYTYAIEGFRSISTDCSWSGTTVWRSSGPDGHRSAIAWPEIKSVTTPATGAWDEYNYERGSSLFYPAKYYFEVEVEICNTMYIGVLNSGQMGNYYPGQATSVGWANNGEVLYNGGVMGTISTYTAGDTLGIAIHYNYRSGYIKFFWRKNGVWQNSADPVAETGYLGNIPTISAKFYPAVSLYDNVDRVTFNYGHMPFANSIPEGYQPISVLCSGIGQYITPIFNMGDKYNQSYFQIDGFTISGTKISYTDGGNIDDVEIRSSDSAPIVREKLWYSINNSQAPRLRTYVPYTDTYTDLQTWQFSQARQYASSTYNYRTGLFLQATNKTAYSRNYVDYFGIEATGYREGNGIPLDYYGDTGSIGVAYSCNGSIDFDYEDNWWIFTQKGYNTSTTYITHTPMHVASNLGQLTFSVNDQTAYCLVAEKSGTGAWYVDTMNLVIYHLDSGCNYIHTIATIDNPRAICATSDNGIWVIDNNTKTAYRFDANANQIDSVYIGSTALWMDNDGFDGFWYINDTSYTHYTEYGTLADGPFAIDGAPTQIRVGKEIVVILCYNDSKNLVYDKSGNLIKSLGGGSITYIPTVISLDLDNFCSSHEYPAPFDPVWGENSPLEWKKVPMNGYAVPKNQYHQLRFTLRMDGDNTPVLKSISSPKVVRISDISPKTSRNVFIRPGDLSSNSIEDIEVKLRTWWYIEE